MDKSQKIFLNYVKRCCQEHNIRLYLGKSKSVRVYKNIYSSGYFDEKTLAVATKKSFTEWFSVLIHEFAHMNQFLERSSFWIKGVSNEDPNVLMDKWLAGEIELTESKLEKVFNQVVECELDCEKRSIKLIQEHNLSIDIETYIKRSNAYVCFYAVCKKYRKWYKHPPHECRKVIEAMPSKFIKDPNKISKNIIKIIYEHCY